MREVSVAEFATESHLSAAHVRRSRVRRGDRYVKAAGQGSPGACPVSVSGKKESGEGRSLGSDAW
jgi:hypothetical protein